MNFFLQGIMNDGSKKISPGISPDASNKGRMRAGTSFNGSLSSNSSPNKSISETSHEDFSSCDCAHQLQHSVSDESDLITIRDAANQDNEILEADSPSSDKKKRGVGKQPYATPKGRNPKAKIENTETVTATQQRRNEERMQKTMKKKEILKLMANWDFQDSILPDFGFDHETIDQDGMKGWQLILGFVTEK